MRPCPECGKEMEPRFGRKRCCHCSRGRAEARVRITQQVHRALRLGLLVRQPCEVCGTRKTGAHHDDYSQPLAVHWLCRRHHQRLHARLWRTGAAQPPLSQGA